MSKKLLQKKIKESLFTDISNAVIEKGDIIILEHVVKEDTYELLVEQVIEDKDQNARKLMVRVIQCLNNTLAINNIIEISISRAQPQRAILISSDRVAVASMTREQHRLHVASYVKQLLLDSDKNGMNITEVLRSVLLKGYIEYDIENVYAEGAARKKLRTILSYFSNEFQIRKNVIYYVGNLGDTVRGVLTVSDLATITEETKRRINVDFGKLSKGIRLVIEAFDCFKVRG